MSPTFGVPLRAIVACVHSMFGSVKTSVFVGSVPEVIDWSGVPTNRYWPPVSETVNGEVAFATESMSLEMWSTSSVSWAAVPFRNSTVYAKSFMRGSKPGRWPVAALTLVAFTSVKYALPLHGADAVRRAGRAGDRAVGERQVRLARQRERVRQERLGVDAQAAVDDHRAEHLVGAPGHRREDERVVAVDEVVVDRLDVDRLRLVPGAGRPAGEDELLRDHGAAAAVLQDRDADGERRVVEARDRQDAADDGDAVRLEREVGAEAGGDVGERVAVEDGEGVRRRADRQPPDLALRRLTLEVDRDARAAARCRRPRRASRPRARPRRSFRRPG